MLAELWALVVADEVPGAEAKVLGSENIGKSMVQLYIEHCRVVICAAATRWTLWSH